MRKKKILDNLKRQQEDNLGRLKASILKVREEADRVLKKIEKDGAEGYYSCNSPLHEWVDKAWKASMTLSELRRIQTSFEDEERRKKLKAKATT
tara:strand:+ start:2522 stop:2803 length:282 start_codon:yes stop_codon:yes gene_type:complete